MSIPYQYLQHKETKEIKTAGYTDLSLEVSPEYDLIIGALASDSVFEWTPEKGSKWKKQHEKSKSENKISKFVDANIETLIDAVLTSSTETLEALVELKKDLTSLKQLGQGNTNIGQGNTNSGSNNNNNGNTNTNNNTNNNNNGNTNTNTNNNGNTNDNSGDQGQEQGQGQSLSSI